MAMRKSILQYVLSWVLFLGTLAGFGIFDVEEVLAQPPPGGSPSAYDAEWLSAHTFQNVGDSPTWVDVYRYRGGSATPEVYSIRNNSNPLPAGAADSFYISDINLPANSSGSISTQENGTLLLPIQQRFSPIGSNGNIVLYSEQPLVATNVLFSFDVYTNVGYARPYNMRLLTNTFGPHEASSQYLIGTVLLNKFNRTTVFAVQNTTNEPIEATINFYDADANGVLASSITHVILAYSSTVVDMGDQTDTGLTQSVFNGSAIISAVRQGTTEPRNVVAAAIELFTDRPVATAYEGVPLDAAASEVHMVTALCERYGLDTFYAVQNASLSRSATIEVTYKNPDGSRKTIDGPYVIGPGQKKSIITCMPSSSVSMSGFTGSAVIVVVAGDAPIVAMGKAQNSINAGSVDTASVLTSFMGQTTGYSKVALPFVRWANDANYYSPSNTGGKQRTFIAIQNLEASDTKVIVKYNDRDGFTVQAKTITIPPNSKANTNASQAGALGQNGMNAGEFGYYANGFGGGVTVEVHADNPNAKFIAIARGQHPGAGEDYNGMCVGSPAECTP